MVLMSRPSRARELKRPDRHDERAEVESRPSRARELKQRPEYLGGGNLRRAPRGRVN